MSAEFASALFARHQYHASTVGLSGVQITIRPSPLRNQLPGALVPWSLCQSLKLAGSEKLTKVIAFVCRRELTEG